MRRKAADFALLGQDAKTALVTPPSSSDPATDEAFQALAPRQQELLSQYLDLFLQSAQLFNLTAIRDRAEAWQRHVIESVRLLPVLGPGTSLIDVGSGGGLPGMVLAIARPALAVTLLEATGKKARFLEQTGHALGLENLTVLCERAESAGAAGSAQRERFDIVTARAVAPLRVLLELTVPFAKPGGLVIAVKGEKAGDELAAAASALRELSTAHEQTVRQPTASVVLLRKRAATSAKYPRRAGEPARSPL
jgi:16S rRNA (guanine527-N7)-methyltransferase